MYYLCSYITQIIIIQNLVLVFFFPANFISHSREDHKSPFPHTVSNAALPESGHRVEIKLYWLQITAQHVDILSCKQLQEPFQFDVFCGGIIPSGGGYVLVGWIPAFLQNQLSAAIQLTHVLFCWGILGRTEISSRSYPCFPGDNVSPGLLTAIFKFFFFFFWLPDIFPYFSQRKSRLLEAPSVCQLSPHSSLSVLATARCNEATKSQCRNKF